MTSTAEIGNLRVRLGIDSAEFANGVRSVQASLSTLGDSIKTFATAAAAVTLFKEAISALHDVADMGDVAEAIGLTAEQLQVYNKMALASGASADVMARGLQSIAEQSTDAKSKLSELFAANGLTTQGKEMNQVILEFMTLLQNAKSPAEQLAIATGVLGDKVGRQLVESMRVGASGWHDAQAEMEKDSWHLSNEQVKVAQAIETRYNELIYNLTSLWQKFIVNIAAGLDSMKVEYVPGRGGARSAVANRPMPGLPVSQTYDGKGDLPGNINSGNGYSVNQATANPFNGISAPKPAVAKPTTPGSLDDIYGKGFTKSVEDTTQSFEDLWKEMESGISTSNSLNESFQNMTTTLVDGLSSAIVGLISGTTSLEDAFKSMAESIVQQLEKIAQEIITSEIFKLLGMMAGGLSPSNAGFSVGGMMFGGVYADGGNLGSGKWGIAGEAGPEIIHGPATITPMDKMPGGSAQMNVSINNYSNANVQARQGSDGRLTVDIMEKELAARVARGGSPLSAGLEKGYGLRRAGR